LFVFQQGGKGRTRGAEAFEGTGATLPVGEYDEGKKRQLQEERHQEYVDQQEQVRGNLYICCTLIVSSFFPDF